MPAGPHRGQHSWADALELGQRRSDYRSTLRTPDRGWPHWRRSRRWHRRGRALMLFKSSEVDVAPERVPRVGEVSPGSAVTAPQAEVLRPVLAGLGVNRRTPPRPSGPPMGSALTQHSVLYFGRCRLLEKKTGTGSADRIRVANCQLPLQGDRVERPSQHDQRWTYDQA